MSGRGEQDAATELEAERTVVEYLREHPDLLCRHPEIVEGMTVPHAVGGAVSLVEYQVSVLRDTNRDLRQRMQELVRNARDNEELRQRIHHLTLSIIDCEAVDDVLARLYHGMREDFQADYVGIRVFVEPRDPADRRLGEFSALLPGLEEVLASDRPVCGRLDPLQLGALFPDQATDIGSAALVPLRRGGVAFGVLGVGSRDPHRYHAGMGTLLLRQLGEVVSHVLGAHVEPR